MLLGTAGTGPKRAITAAMHILFVALIVAAAANDPEAPPLLLEMPVVDPATTTTPPAPDDDDAAGREAAPPPPATRESTTTTSSTTSTTSSAPTTPSPTENAEANLAYETCLRSARNDEAKLVRRCFDGVATRWPDTLAAVRARANVSLLDVEMELGKQTWLPPGRLELVGVAGLFGVWNAIAGGVVVASNVDGGNPGALLLGVSAASLALGVGFGVGGGFIGDALKLDEGASRLVASGLVWGTNMGIGLLPVVFSVDTRGNGTAAVLTVLGGGWAGGLGALALTNVLDLDATGVSMVNSGGIWGSVVGGMVMINLVNAGVQQSAAYSAAYVGSNVLGLVGGGLLSQVVTATWGETLIFDLGAVIGGSVLGFGSFGAMISVGAPGEVQTTVITSAVGVGVLGGYAAGMVAVAMLRDVEMPLLRPFGATIKPTTPKPIAALDMKGQPVAMMPVMALAF